MHPFSWLKGLRSSAARRPVRHRETATIRLSPETLEDRNLPSFVAPVNYGVGASPFAVVSDYFNNDAVLDIAVANYSNSTVGVLLGNVDGTFQPVLTSPTGAYPRSLAVGDFNGDDTLDLATGNANNVSVLLGNGDGTFGAPNNISVGSNPESVAVGDFNGDGNLDLGVTSNVNYVDYYGNNYVFPTVSVLLGNGTGSFAAPVATSLGSGHWGYGNPIVAVAADFNADGKHDLAASIVGSSLVKVLFGTSGGDLTTPTHYATGSAQALIAGDVNGDGKLDVVTANGGLNSVSVLLGNGLGAFAAAQHYPAGWQPYSVAIANFNGDGHMDLVTANGIAGTVSVLLGTGGGVFKPAVNAPAGPSPYGIASGDFDRDGRPDLATLNSTNVTVLINDGTWPALDAPSITVGDVNIAEGNLDTSTATFAVTLSAAPSQTVTVRFATADGSATVAGSDYQAKSGTLTFVPGQPTSQTIEVTINGDRDSEPNESFYLRLSEPTNAFVADDTAGGAIRDDEPHVRIDYGPVIVNEGNSGTSHAVFTVRLSEKYDIPVSVNYSTAEGDTDWWYWGWYEPLPIATSDSDFKAASNTVLTIAAGDTSASIPIVIYGDRLGEVDEYFSVDLSAPSVGVLDSWHAVGIIVNDEPFVSINSTSGVEGNSGATNLTFTVTLSALSSDDVIVSYATGDSSAQAGSDYKAVADSVTIPAGQWSNTFMVQVNGDRVGEGNESFLVQLTSAIGAVVDYYNTGYGTIIDNEPHFTINSVSITEGNSGTKLLTFTVTLSAAYDQTVTVNYATHDSSATAADNDYITTSGTLTFTVGQTMKTFTVTIRGDKKREGDESFYVLLSGASSNAWIANDFGWATILTDEAPRGGRKNR